LKGVSGLLESVLVLAITLALMSVVSFSFLGFLRPALTFIMRERLREHASIREKLIAIDVSRNQSGTYIWLYNYGDTDILIREIYADGIRVPSSEWRVLGGTIAARRISILELKRGFTTLTLVTIRGAVFRLR